MNEEVWARCGEVACFFLCLALALLSGCAPGGPVAEAGADAQLPADKADRHYI